MATRTAVRRTLVVLGSLALVVPLGATASVEATSAASTTGLRSTFADDADGWTALEAGDPATWVSVGGNPGGAMSVQRGSGGTTGLRSPASWAGDRTDLFGGRWSFDLKLGPGVSSSFIEIGLVPASGPADTLYTSAPNVPAELPSWVTVDLTLTDDGRWTQSGAPAGPAEFDEVLGQLSYVYVAAFTSSTSDTLYLDNVELAASVRRSVSLSLGGGRFFGTVRPKGPCAQRQRTTVYRVRPGPDAKVGSATTDRRGEFAVRAARAPAGSYYARVGARFVEGAGDCRAATSKKLRVR